MVGCKVACTPSPSQNKMNHSLVERAQKSSSATGGRVGYGDMLVVVPGVGA